MQVAPLLATRALGQPLDYAVPDGLRAAVRPGSLVACPLGRRVVLGVVVGEDPPTWEGELASVAGVVDAPPIATALVDLAGWVSRYYAAPFAACVRLVLPPASRGR